MDRLLRAPQARGTQDHHPENRVILPEGAVIDIVRVEQVGAYQLRLHFSDGTGRLVDFEPFLRQSRNPLIRVYLDPARFAAFRLQDGDLVWDDYGLCFPVADLYEDSI